MGKSLAIIIMIFWTVGISLSNAQAAEVVLHSGERFSTDKVWEEDGKIRFDLQGLVVSVNKEDVAQVIHSSAPPFSDDTAIRPQETPPSNQEISTPQSVPPPSADEQIAPPPSTAAKPLPRAGESPRHKTVGTGFDGISWLIKPEQIPGIEKIKTDPTYGGIDQYWRPDANLMFGNVALDGLVYGFWRNRLYSIMIWVDGKPAYEKLRPAVFERYGQGKKNEKGLERYVWLDDGTDRMLEFDDKLNTGIFWMRSRELDQQIKILNHE